MDSMMAPAIKGFDPFWTGHSWLTGGYFKPSKTIRQLHTNYCTINHHCLVSRKC